MMPNPEPTPEELSVLAIGRTINLFATDLLARHNELRDGLEGRRILVIGGTGSIGAATLRAYERAMADP